MKERPAVASATGRSTASAATRTVASAAPATRSTMERAASMAQHAQRNMDRFIAAALGGLLFSLVAELLLPHAQWVRTLLSPPVEQHEVCKGLLTTPDRIGSLCGFRNPEYLTLLPTLDAALVADVRHAHVHNEWQWRSPQHTLRAIDLRSSAAPIPYAVWPPPTRTRRKSGKAPPNWLGSAQCPGPLDNSTVFAPTGVAAGQIAHGNDSIVLVTVVNVGRHALELFQASRDSGSVRLQWAGCVPFDDDWVATGVALLEHHDGASSYAVAVPRYRWLTRLLPDLVDRVIGAAVSAILARVGFTTGALWVWQSNADAWQMAAGSGGPMPAFVTAANGTDIFWSDLSGRVCRSVAVNASPPRCGFVPRDRAGLSVAPAGMAFVPSIGTPAPLLVVVQPRDWRSLFIRLRCALGRTPCDVAWRVDVVNPETMQVAPLWDLETPYLGGVANLEDVGNGLLLFGAHYGSRVGSVVLSQKRVIALMARGRSNTAADPNE